jgi:DNA processing protein
MSRGVLVVEADERSGALITARQAIDDHNRPVFAIPGRVDNPLSNGPHRLIRDGAILVTGLQDLLDGLEPLPQSVHDRPTYAGVVADDPAATLFDAPNEAEPEETVANQETRPMPAGDPSDAAILEAIGDEELAVDGIVERSGLEAGAVMTRLTMLTLQGRVERRGGQRFARRRVR